MTERRPEADLILVVSERARMCELAKEALAGKYHFGEPPRMTIDPGMLLDLLADVETLRKAAAQARAEALRERGVLRAALERAVEDLEDASVWLRDAGDPENAAPLVREDAVRARAALAAITPPAEPGEGEK